MFAPWREDALARGVRAAAALPLVHGDRVLGVLNLYSTEATAFDPPEVALLQEVAASLADAVAHNNRDPTHV